MEEWLNDTSVDGFLGNLRDPDKFIVTDSVWDATMNDREYGSITRPNGTITVTDAVGLLNLYEYQTSNHGISYGTGYLSNNGLNWLLLTPYGASHVWYIFYDGQAYNCSSASDIISGIRPSINLKSHVKIVDGDGTIDNPYRLNGDNDTNLSGTLLNKRYSGEYIRFGNDENNLYRIVSHETNGLTKITSAEPLKSSKTFITSAFGNDKTFSTSNTIGSFLNGEYLTNYVGSTYINMIEDNTTWYLGTVKKGENYKLAKYTDTTMSNLTNSTTSTKVGLLRLGELMSGQFDKYNNNAVYWLLTSNLAGIKTSSIVGGSQYNGISVSLSIKPSMNLKSNVIITSGDGTKENPFQVELA